MLNSTRNQKGASAASCRCTNHREDIECCYSGDIAVVGGPELHHRHTPLIRQAPHHSGVHGFPEPVIRVAIEPKTKAGQRRWALLWMEKLAEGGPHLQDPTPTRETGQTIIAGMGELHLEIIVDRLLREFKVEANVGAPRLPIRRPSRAGGAGHQVCPSVRR